MDKFRPLVFSGESFIQNRRKASFEIEAPVFENFLQVLLAKHREIPTLLIVDAYKLRTIWNYLKVDDKWFVGIFCSYGSRFVCVPAMRNKYVCLSLYAQCERLIYWGYHAIVKYALRLSVLSCSLQKRKANRCI